MGKGYFGSLIRTAATGLILEEMEKRGALPAKRYTGNLLIDLGLGLCTSRHDRPVVDKTEYDTEYRYYGWQAAHKE